MKCPFLLKYAPRRGHLVVKHDSLGEILLQAADVTEAHQVNFKSEHLT